MFGCFNRCKVESIRASFSNVLSLRSNSFLTNYLQSITSLGFQFAHGNHNKHTSVVLLKAGGW